MLKNDLHLPFRVMIIDRHVDLKPFNTFGIEATAACLIHVNDPAELPSLHEMNLNEPFFCVGMGSNLLFTKDFEGTLIRMENCELEVIERNKQHVLLRAGAGIEWDHLVDTSLAMGCYGLENLSLIPGTVGSAPVQNIGAYGAEAAQFISEVQCFNIRDHSFVTLPAEDCCFGYRQSIFKSQPEYIVTSVTFRLHSQAAANPNYRALIEYMERLQLDLNDPHMVRKAVMEIRNSKLPDYKLFGNAGSFFKNPVVSKSIFEAIQAKHPEVPFFAEEGDMVKIPAAWLIEKAGWKGHRQGRVGVHEQQPLVLINLGGASGSEVVELARLIQDSIKNNFGIQLHPEVIYI